MKRPSYGIIRIPQESLLGFVRGEILADVPDWATVESVHPNHLARALDVVISSDVPIAGYTEVGFEGKEIPVRYASPEDRKVTEDEKIEKITE